MDQPVFRPFSEEGKTFTDSALYKDYTDRIKGVINIARGNSDTFGKDVELMIKAKMTFDEAINSADYGLMARQRLKIVKDSLFGQLDTIRW